MGDKISMDDIFYMAKLRECVLKATNSRTVEEVEEILQNSIDNSHI